MTSQATSRRLTVQEAAEALGTSVDAVRMRVRRGSLESEKAPDGRVYVYLNDDSSETRPRLDGECTALLESKDETISILRDQLREEREARRRADTIIAQLTQSNAALASRVPELEAPSETRDEPETVEEEPEGAEESHSAMVGAQQGTQRPRSRPWWRRIIGG